jgi:hypothetical protein
MGTRVVPTIVRLVRGLLTRIDDANGRDINITVDTDEVRAGRIEQPVTP